MSSEKTKNLGAIQAHLAKLHKELGERYGDIEEKWRAYKNAPPADKETAKAAHDEAKAAYVQKQEEIRVASQHKIIAEENSANATGEKLEN